MTRYPFIWDSVATSFNGGLTDLESATIKNVKTGKTSDFRIDGAFVWIGILPNTSYLTGAVETDESGFIRVNEKINICQRAYSQPVM